MVMTSLFENAKKCTHSNGLAIKQNIMVGIKVSSELIEEAINKLQIDSKQMEEQIKTRSEIERDRCKQHCIV